MSAAFHPTVRLVGDAARPFGRCWWFQTGHRRGCAHAEVFRKPGDTMFSRLILSLHPRPRCGTLPADSDAHHSDTKSPTVPFSGYAGLLCLLQPFYFSGGMYPDEPANGGMIQLAPRAYYTEFSTSCHRISHTAHHPLRRPTPGNARPSPPRTPEAGLSCMSHADLHINTYMFVSVST